MFLQHMKLVIGAAAAAAVVASSAAQAQTSNQSSPPPGKAKAKASAPSAQQAPQPPPPGAGQTVRPPRGGVGPGVGGQGMGLGMRQRRPMGGTLGNPRVRGRVVQRGMAQLNLTQAQQDQMKALRDERQKDAQGVRERMMAARQKLRETMNADIPDEAAVRAAAGALAAAQTDQFAMRARARTQMMTVLTPEQQKQLKAFRDRGNQVRQRLMQRGQRLQREAMMGRGMRRNQMAPGWGPLPGSMWRQPLMRQGMARRWRGWI